MARTRSVPVALAAAAGLSLVAVGLSPASGASPDDPVRVADGLNNPRQLAVGPGQRLYVAEAGTSDSCTAIPGVDESVQFCGLTGSVTQVRGSAQERVVTGLPTLAFNGELMGASDVDVRGNSIAVLVGGMAAGASARDGLGPQFADFGTLQTGRLKHTPITGADLDVAADLNAYEAASNPDGSTPPDSNAVGFAALDSKNWVVTDAGGNYLREVGKRGESTVAVFPDGDPVPNPFAPPGVEVSPQAVPTDVVVGPDGAYYVSQLTGFPFPADASTIWRVTRDGEVSDYATGLTAVTSLAWKGGTLYAVQYDDENFLDGQFVGSLRQVTPGGSVHDAVASGLPSPYGVAIRGNSAFVTTGSTSSGDGAVVRVDLR